MNDYLLVLNAGSSSLKFAVFRREGGSAWDTAARGQVQGIGGVPRMTARDRSGKEMETTAPGPDVRDARAALDHVIGWLRATFTEARLLGVGHRVVHGGPRHANPVIIDPEVLAELRQLVLLAPLHQPYNISAIELVAQRLPTVPQVACFDTSFHRGMPEVAQLVPLPSELRRKGLTRYGFHGLSCEYVAGALRELDADIASKRVIIAHLGSGASLCALQAGHSVESTMSFTALDGLCMGTRPGAVDPGVILYLFQVLGLSTREVETVLYKKSGLLGISGLSNDMRDLELSAEPSAQLAADYFVYRVSKEIGALAAVLGGLDGFVFTAGIGENSPVLRRRICEAASWLGLKLDYEANASNVQRISSAASAVSVWRIPTNEELMIARHTARLLGLSEPA